MHVYVYVSEVQQSCLKSSSLDKTGTSVGAKSKKETSLPFSMGPVNSHRTSPESIFLWQADMTLDSRGSCIDSHHKHNLLSSFQEPPDTWNYYVSLSKIPFWTLACYSCSSLLMIRILNSGQSKIFRYSLGKKRTIN